MVYLVGTNGEPGKVHKAAVLQAAQKLYQRASSASSTDDDDS